MRIYLADPMGSGQEVELPCSIDELIGIDTIDWYGLKYSRTGRTFAGLRVFARKFRFNAS